MSTEWMNIADLADEHPEKRIHIERYAYAASVLGGRRVLDCACGVGYGTDILSRVAAATGMDIDPAAIELAKTKYPNGHYVVGDITKGFFRPDYFDAFISFETLEHLDDPAALLNSLPENITELIVSAPIRPTVGWNPWHRSDFTHGSLCTAVEQAGFRIVYVKSQPWVDGKGDLYLLVHGRRGNWRLD
jgi:SAM-dependent methyltransferase